MTDAEKAYAKAEEMIAEALETGRRMISLKEQDLLALETIPPSIGGLRELRSLDLNRSKVSDLSPVSKLRHLEELFFTDTLVSDLSPLKNLRRLTKLVLSGTAVSDISLLSDFRDLNGLFLDNSNVSDLEPLTELIKIKELGLKGLAVSDLSPLSGLFNLKDLYLDEALVSDLSPLSRLYSLRWLSLRQTAVKDLKPLSGLRNLEDLLLDDSAVMDLRPLLELERSRRAGRRGPTLQFRGCAASKADAQISEISEMEPSHERVHALYDYLVDWVPPEEVSVPEQLVAPVRAIWSGGLLVEAPQSAELDGYDDDLARDGWEALREFFDDIEDTMRKDNMPNLARAIDAFGRALGTAYDEMRPIGVGTHGQRIIEISKSGDVMLLEDAAGDLVAFAAVISTMLQRFKSWQDYARAQAEDVRPVTKSLDDVRQVSRAFLDADNIAPELVQKFDDLVAMAEDSDVDVAFTSKGLIGSLSNILARLSEPFVAYCQDVGGKTRELSVKTAATGVVTGGGATVDLFFNNGQILAKLAADYPVYLGWLENVLRLLGKI